jgi:hypothetical protein
MQNILLKINTIIKKILGYEYNKWCIAIVDKNNFLKNIIFYPPKNEFWERRKLHTNLLNERKQAVVKKIMAKAF